MNDLDVVTAVDEVVKRIRMISRRKKQSNQWRQWLQSPLHIPAYLVWMCLFFIRHHGRQQFVSDIVENRLRDVSAEWESSAAAGHHDSAPTGVVPGNSDWEYHFFSEGCRLTKRITGEVIAMDLDDEVRDWINYRYAFDYLESLESPSFVEERVVNLHPHRSMLRLSYEEMADTCMAATTGYYLSMDFNREYRLIAELLPKIEARWDDLSIRRAFAAAIGDWSLLLTLVSKPVGMTFPFGEHSPLR